MKFYNYINEKLIKINDKDINIIYEPLDKYVKSFNTLLEVYYDLYKTGDIPTNDREFNEKLKRVFWELLRKNKTDDIFIESPIKIIKSSELISKKCQMADKIKPITIYIFPTVNVNAYSPINNKINMGLVRSYVDIINNINTHAKALGGRWINFINEFAKERIKSTIRHELTHWIDDSLHNLYLTDLIKRVDIVKSSARDSKKLFMQGKSIENLTDREINAIVNQIDQMRKELGKDIWNEITWDNLETYLGTIYSKKWSSEVGYEFRKKLKKRMAREKILGDKMR